MSVNTNHCSIKSCEIPVRVRYCEVDQQGAVHHSRYAVYFEMGRTELLRVNGYDYKTLEENGFILVVAKLEVRYRRPARYDEELLLTTEESRADRVRLEHTYILRSKDSKQVVAEGKTVLVHVDETGKLKGLPDFLCGGHE